MSPHENQPRFDPSSDKGHVESYFLRANHPEQRMALWLKATILRRLDGDAVAELWCVVFDGERRRTWANKATVPYSEAEFGPAPPKIELAGATFVLDRRGRLTGELEGFGKDDGAAGPCKWDLEIEAVDGPLGRRLCMLPFDRLVDASFPKSKLLTPLPLLRFSGTIDVWGEQHDIRGWHGMQGHNWGQEHAWEYVWGQCHFASKGEAGTPNCSVEAFSGKLRLAGRATPFISAIVIRRGEREYRFDRLVDLWRQRPRVDDLMWTLEMRGRDGRAELKMDARPEEMVCLGYHNPDGRLSHCLNSKLAEVSLRVEPTGEPSFECRSAHGGALEFLRNEPDTRFRVV